MPGAYSRTRLWTAAAVAAVGLISAIAGACSEDAQGATKARRVYGEAVAVGNGTARTYIEVQSGVPVEVGVALSEQALEGLPQATHHGGDPHADMKVYTLALPQSNPTQFRFVDLGWNPAGHEPPGIYDVPHFDFHFYNVTESVRNSIDPANPAFKEKTERFPAPAEIPDGYILPAPVAVPLMGVHWVDPASPELHGKPFTSTFIYGTWDGQLIFGEPMITRAFLLGKPEFAAPIAQPQAYQAPGYYPTRYTIRYDANAKEYRIALTELVKHGF